jgi:argininosuccinate lyase
MEALLMIIKALDVVQMLVNAGVAFNDAYTRVTEVIQRRIEEGAEDITDEDLAEAFEGTGAELAAARKQYEATLADSNTPDDDD